MDFTHAYHVAYNVPPRIVSIGLLVKCNINYLTILYVVVPCGS